MLLQAAQILAWILSTLLCGIAVFTFTMALREEDEERGVRLGIICLGLLIVATGARTYGEFTNFDQYVRETPLGVYGNTLFMLTIGATLIFMSASAALYCTATSLNAGYNKHTIYTFGISLLLGCVSLFTNMLNFGHNTGPSASVTLNTISILGSLAALAVMVGFLVELGIKRVKATKS